MAKERESWIIAFRPQANPWLIDSFLGFTTIKYVTH